jgi:hypothetical protein
MEVGIVRLNALTVVRPRRNSPTSQTETRPSRSVGTPTAGLMTAVGMDTILLEPKF